MKGRAFLANTLILTAASLLTRAIGLFLTSFLSRRIGAEGMGLYQLVCTVYALASTLAISGLGVAVSRLVAEAAGQPGSRVASAILGRCMALGITAGLLVGGLLYGCAGWIGGSLLDDGRTVLSLRIIAPSMPVIAASACLRGYFLGVRRAVRSAGTMLLEQISRVLLIMIILGAFISRGLEYACAAVVLGTVGAEVVACAWGLTLWLRDRRLAAGLPGPAGTGGGLGAILAIAVPITAGAFLRSGLRTAENLFLPAGLRRSGLSESTALARYGMMTGMVMPVIMFPSALLAAVSMLIVPEASQAQAAHQYTRVCHIADRAVQLTLLLSILVAGLLAVYANELCMALFGSREAGSLLRLMAPLVPFLYLDFVVDSMLYSLNQQNRSMLYNSADSVLRVGMICLLVPRWGLIGYAAAMALSALFNSSLSLRRLLVVTGLNMPMTEWVIKPALAAALAGTTVSALFRLLAPLAAADGRLIVAQVALTAILYAALLWACRCLGREDTRWALRLLSARRGQE